MSKLKIVITFSVILFSTTRSLALPGEGIDVIDTVDQSGNPMSIEAVKSAAKSQRQMAEAICGGKRDSVLNDDLKKLMKVGLYNYCDQYDDVDRFCGCVGESSYEVKVTDEEIEKFEENLINDSKKNIALNSFKALKEYREEKIREITSMPRDYTGERFHNTYSQQNCYNSKKLMKAISPSCKESDLVALKEALKDSLDECKDCEGMDISSMEQPVERRHRRTPGEDFLYYPTDWLNKKFGEQVDSDEFHVEKINNKINGGSSQYHSIGNVQYKELVESIAKRLQSKWRGVNKGNYLTSFVNQEENKDAAFLYSMNSFYLMRNMKGVPFTLKNSKTGADLRNSVDSYIQFFSDNFPNTVMIKSEINLPTTIRLVKSFLEKKQNEKLNIQCKELVKTLSESCEAISAKEHKLSFDLNPRIAKSIRNSHYKDDKFKFDQLYCVGKGKSENRVFDSFTKRRGWSTPDLNKRIVKGAKNITYNSGLSITDRNLNEVDFSTGVPIQVSNSLATGEHSHLLYSYLPTIKSQPEGLTLSDMPKLGIEMAASSMEPEKPKVGLGTLDVLGSNAITLPTSRYIEATVDSLMGGARPQLNNSFTNLRVESEEESAAKLVDRFVSSQSPPTPRPSKRPDPEIGTSRKLMLEEAISTLETSSLLKPSEVVIPELKPQEIAKSAEAQNARIAESVDSKKFEELPSIAEEPELSKKLSSSVREFTDSDDYQAKKVETAASMNQFKEMENLKDLKFNPNNPNYMMGASRLNKFKGNAEKEPTKEELMEKRINELESKLQTSFADTPKKDSKEISTTVSPTENSFSKKNAESTSADGVELGKLKLELEKMKLELAKSQLELKKKEDKKSVTPKVKASAKVAKKEASPLERARSKSVFSSSNKRGADKGSSSKRSPSSTSSVASRGSSSTSQPSSSQQYSGSSSATSTSNSPESTRISRPAGSIRGQSGALLTATQIGDSQIQNSTNSTVVSYESFKDVSSANQSELTKLYTEYGSAVVTQGGAELILEKDEATGVITVIEKVKLASKKKDTKAISKRTPASVKKAPKANSQRKRFSLDEFNDIIDNGVKK